MMLDPIAAHAHAVTLTRLALEMTARAGSGHPTSAASLAHLVTVLMFHHMRFNPDMPEDPSADRLVLSEGHAVPILYAAGAELGIAVRDGDRRRPMTREDAMTLRDVGSPIDGHPNPLLGFPFFPAATGSLGQGLSIAAGLALGARLDGWDNRIYALIGDGEAREGQVWEAVDFIVEHEITAVCPIFNCNHYGQTGPVSYQQSPEILRRRLEAAGMTVAVVDGHEPSAIAEALDEHVRHVARDSAFAIVARTVKGWGSPSLQTGLHGKAVTGDALDLALRELDATAAQLGVGEGVPSLTRPAHVRREAPAVFRRPRPSFEESLRAAGLRDVLEARAWATRDAFGLALRDLGHADSRVVALDGDVSGSTRVQRFAGDVDLAGRYFEARIGEQNMTSVAVGLASAGRIPFVSTFGKFLTRAYDQLEMGLISGAALKLIGSHTGVSAAADGPSQMAVADVPWFRAWTRVRLADGRPAMVLLNPADAYAAYALTCAMVDHDGACYLRTMRPKVPFVYDGNTRFSIGGHQVVREGSDLVIAASGYMVQVAVAAAQELARNGVHPTVVDLYSLPFDEDALLSLIADNGGHVLTVEDNYPGGIGSAVAEAVATRGRRAHLDMVAVTVVPKSAREPEDLLRYLEIDRASVVTRCRRLLAS